MRETDTIVATIKVRDENNEIPEFEGLTKCCYVGSIPEDAQAGDVVVEVSATDQDSTPAFKTVCHFF